MPKKSCCSRMCLKMLWKGTRQPLIDVELNTPNYHSGLGVKFSEAVMASRAAICHTSSYKSSVELKALLQRDDGMSKMSYKFYHRGVLGNTPIVPEGIEVRTTFTCISTICNTQPFIRLTLNPLRKTTVIRKTYHNDAAVPVASRTRLFPSPFLKESGGDGDCPSTAPNFGV